VIVTKLLKQATELGGSINFWIVIVLELSVGELIR